MKRLVRSVLGISIVSFIGLSICFGQPEENFDAEFPFKNPSQAQCKTGETNIGDCVDVKGDGSIINGLLGVFKLDKVSEGSDHKFINYVKAIVNIALGLVSMVALIMTIYTFYLMFFTENDAGAKKAKGNLIGIFIALAIIGLAWLIVSFIFWWYQENRKSKNKIIEQTSVTSMVEYKLDNQIYLTV